MQFLQLHQGALHYKWIDNSKPRTFLFINSLGTDFRIWDDVVLVLRDYGNIVLFDKRGHGLSDTIEDTNTLNDFAEDVEALTEHLKIRTLSVIGISVGGMIAQILADRTPQKIDKLVLCDTSYKIGSAQSWNDRISLVEEKGLRAISDGVIQRWFSEAFREVEAAKVSGYRNMLEHTPAIGYINTCKAIRDADLTSIAKRITVPTLCVCGSEDKSTTPEEVKKLADLINGSRYEVISGSGHIPCVDNPNKLCSAIIDFLKE